MIVKYDYRTKTQINSVDKTQLPSLNAKALTGLLVLLLNDDDAG